MGDEKELHGHGATTCSRFTRKAPELLHVAEMRDRPHASTPDLNALPRFEDVDAECTVIGDRSAGRGHGRNDMG